MWLFSRDGFVSIVEAKLKPGMVYARARDKAHIEAMFPGLEIFASMSSDYPWRVLLSKEELSDSIVKMVTAINYNNFKDAAEAAVVHGVAEKSKPGSAWWYISALHDVWCAVWEAARPVAPPDKFKPVR